MDTVEKNVEGLAEQIIKEDAERRAQDLVSPRWSVAHPVSDMFHYRICTTLLPKGRTGTSSVTSTRSWRSWTGRPRKPFTP